MTKRPLNNPAVLRARCPQATPFEADSLAELTENIGVNADGLENTVAFWNDVTVAKGENPQFERINGFERIEDEKFYANRMCPETMGPCGGLCIVVTAAILTPTHGCGHAFSRSYNRHIPALEDSLRGGCSVRSVIGTGGRGLTAPRPQRPCIGSEKHPGGSSNLLVGSTDAAGRQRPRPSRQARGEGVPQRGALRDDDFPEARRGCRSRPWSTVLPTRKREEPKDICVVFRLTSLVERFMEQCAATGHTSVRLASDQPDDRSMDGLRLATMHRVKGLEFEYVFVAGLNEGVLPPSRVLEQARARGTEKDLCQSERSLLYVAMTRAKRRVFLSCGGRPSNLVMWNEGQGSVPPAPGREGLRR